jgi:hypothetical protein
MTPASAGLSAPSASMTTAEIRANIGQAIDEAMASLPNPDRLTPEQRRNIIARYSSVLEGNFIYWMTGAYLAVGSDAARSKIIENLLEEVRDSHPNMLHKFTVAAKALPTDVDTVAVSRALMNVRLFIGRLAPVPTVVTMAFFEGWIQKFMPYLAELAAKQGSMDFEYTDVHGVCDITHTEELFNALEAEIALAPESLSSTNLYEGVGLIRTLIGNVFAS